MHLRFVWLASAIAVIISAPVEARTSIIGNWTIEEKRDPITDNPWIIAQVTDAEATNTWLQIRCEDVGHGAGRKPFLIIGVSGDWNGYKVGDRVDGVLRINNGAPTVAHFGVTDLTTGALTVFLSRTTYQNILTAESIGYQVSRADFIPSATFHLAKTSKALKSILDACPLSSAPDVQPSKFDPSTSEKSESPQVGPNRRDQVGAPPSAEPASPPFAREPK